MQLRDYQRATIDALYLYFQNNSGHPLLILPTAAGKSVIIGAFIRELMERWPEQRVLMLTHVKELIAQNAQKLSAIWPEAPMGIYSASLKRRDVWDPIIFAGIQSVYTKADQLGKFDLILVDECHLVNVKSSGMYRRFITDMEKLNPHVKVIGLTATGFRTGSGDITYGDDALFTDVAYEVTILDLLSQGYICRLVPKRMAGEFDTSSLHVRQGEFIHKEVEELVDRDDVTQAALDEVIQYGASRRSWLVFCAGVEHAHNVQRALQDRGVATGCVTGSTPAAERDQIINDYKAGRIKAITNCDVLTTGFDAPATDLLVFLRPTHSPGLYVQMMGRGMRLSPETSKENCLVLDFAGNVIRHGPVDQVKAWRPGKKEKREAPTKTCDECQTIVAVSVRTCPECGFEFPFEEEDKHAKTATNASILSDDIDPHQFLETYQITDVSYLRHEKPGKPPSLRVDYYAGWNRVASEWVCLEHGGYARAKAVGWWRFRSESKYVEAPKSIDAAIEQAESLAKPTSITINISGKYPEIIDHEFSYSEPERRNDPSPGERTADREATRSSNVLPFVRQVRG